MAAIYAGTGGYLDRIAVERVQEFLDFLLARLHAEKAELMERIANGDWDDSIESELGGEIAEAIDDFGADFDEEGNPLEEGESDRIKSEDERAKPGRTAGEDEDSSGDRGQTSEGSDPTEREREPASA